MSVVMGGLGFYFLLHLLNDAFSTQGNVALNY